MKKKRVNLSTPRSKDRGLPSTRAQTNGLTVHPEPCFPTPSFKAGLRAVEQVKSKVEKPKKITSSKPKNKPLSPLSYAHALSRRASRLGFDWPDVSAVLEKLDEEVEELKRAVPLQDRARISEEIGDLFFVLVNIARYLRIDPEKALMGTIKKFRSRFRYIETSLRKAGKSFRQSNMVELDRLWEEAKKRRKQGSHRLREK